MTVDEEELVRFVRVTEESLSRLAGEAARDLRDAVAGESASASRRVADSWTVGGTSQEPEVDSDVWFAHFLARGTRGHGPAEADRLVFRTGGQLVFAEFVSGIAPNAFRERAVGVTERRVDSILARSLAGVA